MNFREVCLLRAVAGCVKLALIAWEDYNNSEIRSAGTEGALNRGRVY